MGKLPTPNARLCLCIQLVRYNVQLNAERDKLAEMALKRGKPLKEWAERPLKKAGGGRRFCKQQPLLAC